MGSRRLAVAVVVVFALAGCSSTAASPEPSSSASPSSTDFTDASSVAAALSAAGHACTGPTAGSPGTTVGAESVLDCSSPGDTGQPDTVIIVFDTHGDAQIYAAQMLADPGVLPGTQLVVGTTWAVDTQAPYGVTVAGLLGGDVQGVSASS